MPLIFALYHNDDSIPFSFISIISLSFSLFVLLSISILCVITNLRRGGALCLWLPHCLATDREPASLWDGPLFIVWEGGMVKSRSLGRRAVVAVRGKPRNWTYCTFSLTMCLCTFYLHFLPDIVWMIVILLLILCAIWNDLTFYFYWYSTNSSTSVLHYCSGGNQG